MHVDRRAYCGGNAYMIGRLSLLKLPLVIECRSLAFSQQVYIYLLLHNITIFIEAIIFINLETIINLNNSFKVSLKSYNVETNFIDQELEVDVKNISLT